MRANPQIVTVKRKALAANDEKAQALRSLFKNQGCLVVNLISSPGSGKTTLLEATIRHMKEACSFAVIEGDVAPEPVLAVGGHLQVTACVATGRQAVMSQHVGDLDTEGAREFHREVIIGLEELLGVTPTVLVADRHPDYPSTWFAREIAEDREGRVIETQHHLAHAAAVLAEHGLFPELDETVLAVILDGTGWGPDGTAWGGEWLSLTGRLVWRRVGHLECLALVGGERAIKAPIGDHGATIMACRHGLAGRDLQSDCAPLASMVESLFDKGIDIYSLHDPTRGGIVTVCNEAAEHAVIRIELDEASIPVSPQVRAVCEILGLEALSLACEGRLLAWVAESDAERALEIMRGHALGRGSAAIGRVETRDANEVPVVLKTMAGGTCPLDLLSGADLPRIC